MTVIDPKRVKIAVTKVAGPSSYPTGGFSVTIGDLNIVLAVLNVKITGGYRAEHGEPSGNSVPIIVRQYDYPATAAGPAPEVPAGTDLSGQTVEVVAIGV